MKNRSTTFPLSCAFFAMAISLIACSVTACGEKVNNAPKAGDDIIVPAFTWRVRTPEQIGQEYADAGKDPGQGQAVDAYTGKQYGATIVTTQAPRYVDDNVACTLGHEVMHVALGDYHARREAK